MLAGTSSIHAYEVVILQYIVTLKTCVTVDVSMLLVVMVGIIQPCVGVGVGTTTKSSMSFKLQEGSVG